jgi:hypothetical protein
MLDQFFIPPLAVILATALLIYVLGWIWPGATRHDPAADAEARAPIPFPGQPGGARHAQARRANRR